MGQLHHVLQLNFVIFVLSTLTLDITWAAKAAFYCDVVVVSFINLKIQHELL